MTATPAQRAAALKWVSGLAAVSTVALKSVVEEMVTEGYLVGAGEAVAQLAPEGVSAMSVLWRTASGIDWDNWKPGSQANADIVKDGGLAKLLDDVDITIQGVTDTTLGRIADRLADALAAGDSVETLAGSLTDLLDGPAQADLVSVTETARAMVAGSLQTYADAGVERFDFNAEDDACQECLDLEDGSPYDLDDSDAQIPAHPLCRCYPTAVIPSNQPESASPDDEGESE